MTQKGTVVISIDCEYAWGAYDRNYFNRLKPVLERVDETIDMVLTIMSRYSVPGTWAIVSHLVYDCRPNSVICQHLENLTSYTPPCKSNLPERLWYRPDIVGRILKADAAHEIAGHGFHHLVLDERTVPKAARIEIRATRDLLQSLSGRPIISYIHPRNILGHLHLLWQYNIHVVRGSTRSLTSHRLVPTSVTRLNRLLSEYAGTAPHLVSPIELESGVVRVPGSKQIKPRRSWWRVLPEHTEVKRIKRGIERTITEGGIFHIWFHPHDLVSSEDKSLDIFKTTIKLISDHRDAGALEVVTLSEFSPDNNAC